MTADVLDAPLLPRDADGPVFREPWEAQAFAIVVALQRAGAFTAAEWAEALNREILAAQSAGDPDLGDTYYRHWLSALEHMVRAKALTSDAELRVRLIALRHAPVLPHGHVARREPVHVDGIRA